MSKAGKIIKVLPESAIPGGEIEVLADGLRFETGSTLRCIIGEHSCRTIAASSRRVLAEVPPAIRDLQESNVRLEFGDVKTDNGSLRVSGLLAEEMHIVANPAVDPKDEAIILTRSGGRGQQLPNTLYRLETDGYLDELPVEVMNPTGIAFGPDNEMYVTNRRDGVVYRIERGEEAIPVATGLGIATGIAFNKDGVMFVGDRSGIIYRILADGTPDEFAKLEPSVAAYHLAFGPDGRLFVSAPGLASHEAIYAIGTGGSVETFFRGFGRPQGIAFDTDGTLYIAACYRGKRGIFAIDHETGAVKHIVSGNSVVGLCFTREGSMIVATGDSAYTLPLGIKGTLLVG